MVFLETQNSLKSLRAFQGSSRDPESRSFVFLAEALLAEGSVEEAKQVLEGGLASHPTLSGAHLLLARVREASGDRVGARAACRALEALDPLNRSLPGLLERLAATVPESEPARPPEPEPEPLSAPDSELQPLVQPEPVRVDAREPEGAQAVAPEAAPEAAQAGAPASPAPQVAETESASVAPPQDLDFFEPFAIAAEVASPARAEPDALPTPAPPALPEPAAPPAVPEPTMPGSVPQTRTLAELYVSQGHTLRAIGVYEALVAQRPGDQELVQRLAALRGAALRGEPAEASATLGSDASAAPAAPTPQPAPHAASPFDGVEGLEDFGLWLEHVPVLPEVTHGRRES
jgi:predicted Zn-dependent protease